VAKYVFFFTYTSEAWGRMVQSPGDRSAAVRQLIGSLGGSFESIYWMTGAYDGLLIADFPDSVGAAALSVTVGSTGSFKTLETHELFTQAQLSEMLSRTRDATRAYQPPGQQS
jgi:uncharacterized protein with GYD domain